jgi:hypothetical protein
VNWYTCGGQSAARAFVPPGGGSFTVIYNGYNDQDGEGSGVFGRTFVGMTAQETGDVQLNTSTSGFQIGGAVVFVEGSAVRGSNQTLGASAAQAFPNSLRDNVVVYSGPSAADADGGVLGRRSDSAGAGGPGEDEFLINTYTTGQQGDADACAGTDGSFVVVWNSEEQDGDGFGMFARRFDADAAALGPEFQVNTYTIGGQAFGRVCCAVDGSFTVAWTDLDGLDGQFSGVFARRFNSTGSPLGDQYQVNTYTSSSSTVTSVACDAGGRTVVVWQTLGRQLSGQAYAADGQTLGSEFTVSQSDVGVPQQGSAAMAENGTFVVAWYKRNADGDHDGIQARRFAFVDGTTTTSLPPTTSTTTTSTSTSTTIVAAGNCGDPIPDASSGANSTALITASDALFVLRAGVGLSVCETCVCDVDGSGAVSATDALAVLNIAVGVAVPLNCPAC